MNHQEFIDKYIGTSYKETEELGVQCVGGVKLYTKERGWKIGNFGGSAIKGWTYGMPFDKKWKRVIYKPGMFPPEGALIFWSEKRCLNGHVAVSNSHCNKDVLRCFDQNGTGVQDTFTHRFYGYKNVLGWMIHSK